MELKHDSFSIHEHPLELSKFPQDGVSGSLRFCSSCKRGISCGEWIYTCKTCNSNFHISCSSQTPEFINHPLHPQHPLVFKPYGEPIPEPPLNPDLPFLLRGIQYLLRPQMFRCGACGLGCDTDTSYRCSLCNFGAHVNCAYSKPVYVNHISHRHTLHLSSSSCSNAGWTRSCCICDKSIEGWSWYYRCGSCTYYNAHLACATKYMDHENITRSLIGVLGFPRLILESKVNGAKTVTELQNEITDLKTKYEDSAKTVSALHTEISDLKTKYIKNLQELQHEITSLKGKCEDLRKLFTKENIGK